MLENFPQEEDPKDCKTENSTEFRQCQKERLEWALIKYAKTKIIFYFIVEKKKG